MTRPLKVYTTSYGRYMRVVATRTKKEAKQLLGATDNYIGETGNEDSIAQAMSEPGVVFRRRGYGPNDSWERNSSFL